MQKTIVGIHLGRQYVCVCVMQRIRCHNMYDDASAAAWIQRVKCLSICRWKQYFGTKTWNRTKSAISTINRRKKTSMGKIKSWRVTDILSVCCTLQAWKQSCSCSFGRILREPDVCVLSISCCLVWQHKLLQDYIINNSDSCLNQVHNSQTSARRSLLLLHYHFVPGTYYLNTVCMLTL